MRVICAAECAGADRAGVTRGTRSASRASALGEAQLARTHAFARLRGRDKMRRERAVDGERHPGAVRESNARREAQSVSVVGQRACCWRRLFESPPLHAHRVEEIKGTHELVRWPRRWRADARVLDDVDLHGHPPKGAVRARAQRREGRPASRDVSRSLSASDLAGDEAAVSAGVGGVARLKGVTSATRPSTPCGAAVSASAPCGASNRPPSCVI